MTRPLAAALARRRTRRIAACCAAAALAACADPAVAPPPPLPTRAASAGALPGDNVVLRWDAVALEAIRATRPGPPMTARALAVLHTAMYDAWAAYDAAAVGTRLGGALRRPEGERTAANKATAVSYAAYRALVDLYPSRRTALDALMTELGHDPAVTSTDPATAAGVGNAAAAAVLAFRHRDGANQLGDEPLPGGGTATGAYADYTGYAPVNTPDVVTDPNRWQPLRLPNGSGGFATQRFVAPHWQRVTPFALTAASQFRPVVLPNQYPRGGYQKQVEELLHYTARLDDQTKVVAEYWADGPSSELPPGHWCLLGAWVARRDHQTLDESVKMFFALSNAIFDASIAAWDAKREFDSVRPVTAVRFWKAGKMVRSWGGPGRGVVTMRGEEWRPYQPETFLTPPFPEFISGHSAFSAAGAEILKRFTGSDAFGASVVVPAGSSRVEPGLVPARAVTLTWPTFSAAADEAGLSRRYGGIHFVEGDVQSRAIGRKVGGQAWAKAVTYFEGTAR